MSTSYKCSNCPRHFSSRNAYSQHVNKCIDLIFSSTEESEDNSSDIASNINDASMDYEDFSNIEELQNICEENLYASDPEYATSNYLDNDEIFQNEEPTNLQSEDENLSSLQPEVNEILSSMRSEDSESLRSHEESEEFPNDSYADFMKLVIENNLSNKVANAIIKFFNSHSSISPSPLPANIETGRKLFDKINKSCFSYSKHLILVYNNKEYFIHYYSIKECIKNILSNPKIIQHFVYNYQNLQFEGEKSYGEQYTGNWWSNAETLIPNKAHILSIILYSDATSIGTLGKSSLHPIYMSLGNIPIWRRNKEDAKQFLGFLPIISANSTEKNSSEFKKLVRETFHNSIRFLLDPLFENASGIEFKVNGENIWFYPKISSIICDWPEACVFSLTYKLANANYPCHFCLVPKDKLNKFNKKGKVILRNHENMQEYLNNGDAATVSLEQVKNYFWNIP